jgi:hypothetical protein
MKRPRLSAFDAAVIFGAVIGFILALPVHP